MPEATPPAVSPETPPATPPAEPPANPPSPPATTWRDAITDPELKNFVAQYTDQTALAKAARDLRQKVNSAIVLPGKDAKPEQIADFRSKMGVPESADGYKFHTPEGYKPTESDLAFQKEWAKDFYDLNFSADQAFKISEKFNARMTAAQTAQLNFFKENAAASEAAMRKTWGTDYEENIKIGGDGAKDLFGKNFEAARQLLGQDGKPVLDNPIFIEAMAAYGRESARREPGLRGTVSPELRAPMQEQVDDLTRKIHDARARNDHIGIRQLDAKRMELMEKLHPGTNAPPGAQAA